MPRRIVRRKSTHRKKKTTTHKRRRSSNAMVISGRGAYKRKRVYAKRRVSSRRGAIRGRGAYSNIGMSVGSSPPSMHSTKDGFVIRHREYLGDITASTSFAGLAYPLNPGLSSSFPWLAAIAENFEEWIPRGIEFEYKTTSSDAVVSTTTSASLGTVIMATEYNPLNGTFANKV